MTLNQEDIISKLHQSQIFYLLKREPFQQGTAMKRYHAEMDNNVALKGLVSDDIGRAVDF
ncbi:MAG: hypothetical protein MJA27_01710 [Pseudanabaenales cyanobacterium]|nr:hypothetical protein [Pseudanabaenales cyanobacterium]